MCFADKKHLWMAHKFKSLQGRGGATTTSEAARKFFWEPEVRERAVKFVPNQDQDELRGWIIQLGILLRVMESGRRFDLDKLKIYTNQLYKRTLDLGRQHGTLHRSAQHL